MKIDPWFGGNEGQEPVTYAKATTTQKLTKRIRADAGIVPGWTDWTNYAWNKDTQRYDIPIKEGK